MVSRKQYVELMRRVARQAYTDGIRIGQKHAELIDDETIDRLGEVYAAEFEMPAEEGA